MNCDKCDDCVCAKKCCKRGQTFIYCYPCGGKLVVENVRKVRVLKCCIHEVTHCDGHTTLVSPGWCCIQSADCCQ